MSLRRVVSALFVGVIASTAVVAAAPKKTKKGPVAPAKDPSTGSGSGSGSAAGSAAAPVPAPGPIDPNAPVAPVGTEVQMTEDAPPSDMQGTDENPDAPRGTADPEVTGAAPIPVKKVESTGYPIEEVRRPITLPENMSELSIGPHFAVDLQTADGLDARREFVASDALRARYGITRQIQLGLTYEYGGLYKDSSGHFGFQTGKAVGLDLTVLLQNWIAVKVGVPVYLDPVAVSLQLAAPIKFTFGNFAIGGLDDLLNIKLHRFVPSFVYQSENDRQASEQSINTTTSNGDLRFSVYAEYQLLPNLAVMGRFGVLFEDLGGGTSTSYLRGFLQWTPHRNVDLGVGLGFDDLGHGGTFGPNFLLAVRI